MLILSRKQEESIVIGDDIVIKVIMIDKGSVKLGFEAPSDKIILRKELKDAIVSKNVEAAEGKDEAGSLSLLSNISSLLGASCQRDGISNPNPIANLKDITTLMDASKNNTAQPRRQNTLGIRHIDKKALKGLMDGKKPKGQR